MADEVLGDIFWDLSPWMYYTAAYDLGCTIYVANITDTDKEYSLMTRVYRNNVLLSEGVLQVYDHAWFTVEAGDFIRLYGTIKVGVSDAQLVVNLVEKVTQNVVDSVSTILVTPTTSALPPAWNIPGIGSTTDLMSLMMMVMMIVMMVKMMGSAFEPKKIEQ